MRNVSQRIVLVHGRLERIVVSLYVHFVVGKYVLASILARTVLPLVYDRQLDHVALIGHGVEIPLVAIGKEWASHQGQYTIAVRKNSQLAIVCIDALCGNVYWRACVNSIVAKGRIVRIAQNVCAALHVDLIPHRIVERRRLWQAECIRHLRLRAVAVILLRAVAATSLRLRFRI